MKKNISVIIPTFNGEEFLEKQIESIVPQLIRGDRIICLDDASTDMTLKVLSRLSTKYVMLNYFSSTVNRGPNLVVWDLLQLVTDDLFVFCDQDDIWLPGRLDVVRRCGVGELSVVGYLPFTSSGEYFEPVLPKSINLFRTFFKPSVPGCTIGGCVHTARKLFFSGYIKTLYDQFILINALLKGVKIITDMEVRVLYRRHEGTITRMGIAPNGVWRALIRRVDILKDIFHEIQRSR